VIRKRRNESLVEPTAPRYPLRRDARRDRHRPDLSDPAAAPRERHACARHLALRRGDVRALRCDAVHLLACARRHQRPLRAPPGAAAIAGRCFGRLSADGIRAGALDAGDRAGDRRPDQRQHGDRHGLHHRHHTRGAAGAPVRAVPCDVRHRFHHRPGAGWISRRHLGQGAVHRRRGPQRPQFRAGALRAAGVAAGAARGSAG